MHTIERHCSIGRKNAYYRETCRKNAYYRETGRTNAYYRETSAVIWGKLACPSERVQRERHSACALNGPASFSQTTADLLTL